MKRNESKFEIVLRTARMYASTEFEYRMQIVVAAITDLISPIILSVVWSGASYSNSAFTKEEVFSYFFFVAIVAKFVKDYSDRIVGDRIISGEFSKYLVKPYNYLYEILGISLGSKVPRILVSIPILAFVYFLFQDRIVIDYSYERIILTILAAILAFSISFFLGNIFSLLAFFIKQMRGMRVLYESIVLILSGEVIPPFALPPTVSYINSFLPFRYSLAFPVEILIGTINEKEIIFGFLVAFIWMILLLIIYKVIYRIGIRKYESEGI